MLKVANSVISASRITGTLPVANGGTGVTTSTGTGNTVLSATPTLSGDITLSTGNLVIGTSGKGIDFSITASGSGTMTSELLADYEEGTWTPIDSSGAGLTFTSVQGTYTKVGRVVSAICRLNYPSTASTSNAVIGGLPFAAGSHGAYSGGGSVQQKSAAAAITGLYIAASATTATVADNQNGLMQNVVLSSAQLYINFVYYA